MDIQVVHAYQEDRWILVHRTLDGVLNINRMPKEMLAMRAAEYNLELDDPMALDIMMLEHFYEGDPEADHPLHASETIEEALAVMKDRIESVRVEHGSPADPHRMLAHAIEKGVATEGLIKSRKHLIKHGDKRVIEPVQFYRDKIRAQKKFEKKIVRPPLHEELRAMMTRPTKATLKI